MPAHWRARQRGSSPLVRVAGLAKDRPNLAVSSAPGAAPAATTMGHLIERDGDRAVESQWSTLPSTRTRESRTDSFEAAYRTVASRADQTTACGAHRGARGVGLPGARRVRLTRRAADARIPGSCHGPRSGICKQTACCGSEGSIDLQSIEPHTSTTGREDGAIVVCTSPLGHDALDSGLRRRLRKRDTARIAGRAVPRMSIAVVFNRLRFNRAVDTGRPATPLRRKRDTIVGCNGPAECTRVASAGPSSA
jgi:hypothetical protein